VSSKKRILAEDRAVGHRGRHDRHEHVVAPLQQLAGAFKSPERFIGLHFFSPVPAMKLVEVGRLPSPRRRGGGGVPLVEKIGKTPILLGDEPGYIVNRLLVPYLCQAIDMLEQGVARAQDIDAAMKLGCGHPLGPLALSDLIGLDIVFAMAQTLSNELRDKRFKPPTLLRRLVLAGHLGKKSKARALRLPRRRAGREREIRAALSAPDLTAVG